MSFHGWTLLLSSLEALLALLTLLMLLRERTISRYWPLFALVCSGSIPYFLLLWLRTYRFFSPKIAYEIYFFTFWSLYTVAAIASAAMTYIIFNEALRPLTGLKNLGRVMYLWTGSVSIAVALGSALLPHPNVGIGVAQTVSELTRVSGIIVVSLILFVGFAIRPLGLSMRSRVFGTGLGIGIIALTNVLLAGHLMDVRVLYSRSGVTLTAVQCVAEIIWVYYFSRPEPQRKFVLLPTTSPFHSWNQISEILGHDPGYVAIGGVPPEAFAPAELDIFQRASRGGVAGQELLRSRAPGQVRRDLPAEDKEALAKKTAHATERLMEAFRSEA